MKTNIFNEMIIDSELVNSNLALLATITANLFTRFKNDIENGFLDMYENRSIINDFGRLYNAITYKHKNSIEYFENAFEKMEMINDHLSSYELFIKLKDRICNSYRIDNDIRLKVVIDGFVTEIIDKQINEIKKRIDFIDISSTL